jgi:hypothetical protein
MKVNKLIPRSRVMMPFLKNLRKSGKLHSFLEATAKGNVPHSIDLEKYGSTSVG